MGLINISHKEIAQSISNFQADLLKNPYYLFNDKKAHIVNYYNLNEKRSTLDESLRLHYSELDENTPFRYNLIRNFYLYGLDRIALSLDNSEYGLESSSISGEAIILPDTIKPYPGDYFTIDNLKMQSYLFKVTEVQIDTFDDGGNYYKINYTLDRLTDSNISDFVVEEYEFNTINVGTNFNPIVKKAKWDLATKLDDTAVMLKKYYKALFYNHRVQTYTYNYKFQRSNCSSHNGFYSTYIYDPYLIEFIIKNDVLKNDGDEYLYIGHSTKLRPEFPIKYVRSFWRTLESKEFDNIDSVTIESRVKYISDPSTIFKTRYEDYFEMQYNIGPLEEYIPSRIDEVIQLFDAQLIGHIKNNQLFDYDDFKYSKYNIIIKYMNNQDLDIEDIILFERVQENDNSLDNFFAIPMCIFCIERYIHKLLQKKEGK